MVRNPSRSVILEMEGGPYRRTVVDVDDPAASVAAVEGAQRTT